MTGPEAISDQDLRDELALRALSTSYAAAADLRDGDRFAALFVEDGELVVPDYPVDFGPVLTRSGRERLRQIPDFLRQYPRTFHQVTNHEFAIDGDTAAGNVQCVAHHLTAIDPSVPPGSIDGSEAEEAPAKPEAIDFIWYIRYRDDYRRVDGDWKFQRRSIHLQFVEERPVLRMGLPLS
ncbi:MAG TPA: nuclear transport factor 2 family protein [Acidimicrobiales bacterium]|jgi:hypothetical protein|nr:nuclear transport factor 2 family protein [Acidimicrobiales bacterium]